MAAKSALLLAFVALTVAPAMAKVISQMYVFGDESMDVGNANMYKNNPSRANMPPYSFSFKPTSGRASDGKLVVDYLADYLAIPTPRADFYPPNASVPFSGLNFAVAGSGSRPVTNSGKTRGLQQQFNAFKKWYNEAERTNNPNLKIDESMFVISIGANDYLSEFLKPEPNNTLLVQATTATTNTIISVAQAIFNLTGSSNIIVFDAPPIGCIPAVREAHGLGATCLKAGNDIADSHNYGMLIKSDKLRVLPGAPMPNLLLFKQSAVFKSLLLVNTTGFTNFTGVCCQNVTAAGVRVRCGETGGSGKTAVTALACPAPAKYVWWDSRNPSQAANSKLANTVFYTANPNMVRASSTNPKIGGGIRKMWVMA